MRAWSGRILNTKPCNHNPVPFPCWTRSENMNSFGLHIASLSEYIVWQYEEAVKMDLCLHPDATHNFGWGVLPRQPQIMTSMLVGTLPPGPWFDENQVIRHLCTQSLLRGSSYNCSGCHSPILFESLWEKRRLGIAVVAHKRA